jgi:hypothetical protein
MKQGMKERCWDQVRYIVIYGHAVAVTAIGQRYILSYPAKERAGLYGNVTQPNSTLTDSMMREIKAKGCSDQKLIQEIEQGV